MLKILISNDDGINAPGIHALYNGLKQKNQCTVVAPTDEKSTTGHTLSLDHPVRLHQLPQDSNLWHCTGFPADCVLVGLGHVLKNNRPDFIVTGINRGANLGQDLYYSGTMASAREGAFHHIPSMATSLVIKRSLDTHYFNTAAAVIAHLVEQGIHRFIAPMTMINVNVPNVALEEIKGVKLTCMGFRKYSELIEQRTDSRGRSYYWIGGQLEGHHTFSGLSDCEVVEDNFVSVTPLGLIHGQPTDFSLLEKFILELAPLS
jgi:5'-nucleotidase